MRKTNFLDKAKDANSLLSEQRVLDSLAKLNKAVVISMKSKENIQKHFFEIKNKIKFHSRIPNHKPNHHSNYIH